MNIIESLIKTISPKWAHSRNRWLNALDGYDAGRKDAPYTNWTPINNTAENINKVSRDFIRTRARDLERNSEVANTIIDALKRNVVGTGIKLQAKTEDFELNKQIEDNFKEWCEVGNCDTTKRFSFLELQELALTRLFVDGGCIFVFVQTDEGFKLQPIEVDDLATDTTQYGSNPVIGGIEIGKYKEHVAYHFKEYDSSGLPTGKTIRIEANRAIYLNKVSRFSQIREVSKLAVSANRIKDINEYVEAVNVKERILACLAIFIKRALPSSFARGRNGIENQSGYKEKTLAPGVINELQPGDSVDVVNPSGQAANAKELITAQQRIIGAAHGLSYEATSRDVSQVNYSSARQNLLEDQKTYKSYQIYLIEHFCKPIYREWLKSEIIAKRLPVALAKYIKNPKEYNKHTWQAQGWSWIDPVKEVTANKIALETNQATMESICAQNGNDWREIIDQLAIEKEYISSRLNNKEVLQQKEYNKHTWQAQGWS